jgi:hypothetical protein
VLCRARRCGAIAHLADDLDLVTLPSEVVTGPPLELFPTVLARSRFPDDVERLLVGPFRHLDQPPTREALILSRDT